MPVRAQVTNVLKSGFAFDNSSGTYLVATNRAFYAIADTGSLCIWEGSQPATRTRKVWCSPKAGDGFTTVVLSAGGDLCVKTATGGQWCTNTSAKTGDASFLLMNGDGNLLLYGGAAPSPKYGMWQSNTAFANVAVLEPPAGATIKWFDDVVCPPVCARNIAVGQEIKFTIPASTQQLFQRWTGRCDGQPAAQPCVIRVDPYTPLPPVSGRWTSDFSTATISLASDPGLPITWPDGQQCTGSCSRGYPVGSIVELNALPTTNDARLSYWLSVPGERLLAEPRPNAIGPCDSLTTNPCRVTAVLNLLPISAVAAYAVRLHVLEQGSVVWSNSSGGVPEYCGLPGRTPPTCEKFVTRGENVTLTASQPYPFHFQSWTGCAMATGPQCAFTVTPAIMGVPIAAVFTVPTRPWNPKILPATVAIRFRSNGKYIGRQPGWQFLPPSSSIRLTAIDSEITFRNFFHGSAPFETTDPRFDMPWFQVQDLGFLNPSRAFGLDYSSSGAVFTTSSNGCLQFIQSSKPGEFAMRQGDARQYFDSLVAGGPRQPTLCVSYRGDDGPARFMRYEVACDDDAKVDFFEIVPQ